MINTAISILQHQHDEWWWNFEALACQMTWLPPWKHCSNQSRHNNLDYHLPAPASTGTTKENPTKSCKTLYDGYPHAESGYYWIGTKDSPVKVYCNMNAMSSGKLTGGWMRVAYVDMRNTSHQCPSGWSLLSRSSAPHRVCDITRDGACVSNSFTVHGVEYSHVYGRIIAYQKRVPLAFYYITDSRYNNIDEPYVYGVSLTHGKDPRRHIWTFAGASDESSIEPNLKCPCINTNISSPPPVPDIIIFVILP